MWIMSNTLGMIGAEGIIVPWRLEMSHRATTTLFTLLGLLTTLNLIVLGINISLPSRAAVGGMSYQSLIGDPDFTRAVKTIAQECKVNVDIAKLMC